MNTSSPRPLATHATRPADTRFGGAPAPGRKGIRSWITNHGAVASEGPVMWAQQGSRLPDPAPYLANTPSTKGACYTSQRPGPPVTQANSRPRLRPLYHDTRSQPQRRTLNVEKKQGRRRGGRTANLQPTIKKREGPVAGNVEGHQFHGTVLAAPGEGTAGGLLIREERKGGMRSTRARAQRHKKDGRRQTERTTGRRPQKVHTTWNGVPPGDCMRQPNRTTLHAYSEGCE